jgi:hypothetical protein
MGVNEPKAFSGLPATASLTFYSGECHHMRSGFIALVIACGLSAAALAAELQPQSIAFLVELGIDPKSPKVTGIINDQVRDKNLNSLAAIRDRDGVQRFIATRNFVHAYVKDMKTPFPPSHLYSNLYLTPEEVTTMRKLQCDAEKALPQKPTFSFCP